MTPAKVLPNSSMTNPAAEKSKASMVNDTVVKILRFSRLYPASTPAMGMTNFLHSLTICNANTNREIIKSVLTIGRVKVERNPHLCGLFTKGTSELCRTTTVTETSAKSACKKNTLNTEDDILVSRTESSGPRAMAILAEAPRRAEIRPRSLTGISSVTWESLDTIPIPSPAPIRNMAMTNRAYEEGRSRRIEDADITQPLKIIKFLAPM